MLNERVYFTLFFVFVDFVAFFLVRVVFEAPLHCIHVLADLQNPLMVVLSPHF